MAEMKPTGEINIDRVAACISDKSSNGRFSNIVFSPASRAFLGGLDQDTNGGISVSESLRALNINDLGLVNKATTLASAFAISALRSVDECRSGTALSVARASQFIAEMEKNRPGFGFFLLERLSRLIPSTSRSERINMLKIEKGVMEMLSNEQLAEGVIKGNDLFLSLTRSTQANDYQGVYVEKSSGLPSAHINGKGIAVQCVKNLPRERRKEFLLLVKKQNPLIYNFAVRFREAEVMPPGL